MPLDHSLYTRLVSYRLLLDAWQQSAGFRLDVALRQQTLDSPADRRWLRSNVYGTCRTWHACAYLLTAASKHPLHRLDARVRVLLQLGTYWLRFVDAMPAYAAVQQIGELARKIKLPKHLQGYINAVLRHVAQDAPIPPDAWLPGWLQTTADEATITALQHPPAMGIRLRPGATPNKLSLIQAFEAAGLQVTEGLRPDLLLLHGTGAVSLTEVPGFMEGHWLVQDASSAAVAQTIADYVAENPADAPCTIVDACAGLGMKTLSLADALPNAAIIALEPDTTRFAQLQHNLARCGLAERVKPIQTTAQQWQPTQPIDWVLTDVPCSATGTVRRHPEILLRTNPLDDALLQQQRDILAAVTRWNPSHLVYSTCSLLNEENLDQVERLVAQGYTLKNANRISIKNTNDGFFIAILSH